MQKSAEKTAAQNFCAAVLYVGLVLTKDIIRVNVQYFTGLRDRVYRDDLLYESNRPTTTVTGRELSLIHILFRPAIAWLEKLPQKVAFWLALVLGIMIAADYLVMMIYGGVVGHFPEYWSIRFGR